MFWPLSAVSETHCRIIMNTLQSTVFAVLFMTLLNTVSTPRILLVLTQELRGLLRVPMMLGPPMLHKDTVMYGHGADMICLETGALFWPRPAHGPKGRKYGCVIPRNDLHSSFGLFAVRAMVCYSSPRHKTIHTNLNSETGNSFIVIFR